jgi:hypothetical protein
MPMPLRKLLLCLFITIALASQGIAGAVMSVQMAGAVSSHGDMRNAAQMSHQAPVQVETSSHASDHAAHHITDASFERANTAGTTSAPDHESHFKCAACLFFCSGVSTPYDTSSVAHAHTPFDVPMWVTPNLQDVPPSGLFRPPQTPLA